MKNEIFLSFCIWDFDDITHEQISEAFGLHPTKIYVKGMQKNPRSPALAKQNGWILDSSCGKHSPFATQLDSLLDVIEGRKLFLKPFFERYYCEFSLALYIYSNEESTPSVHLSSRYHELAKELKFEFDLDLYCLQNT